MKDKQKKLVPAPTQLFEAIEKIKTYKWYAIYAQVNSIQVVSCEDEESAKKLANSRSGVIMFGEILDYVDPVHKKEKKVENL